MNKLNNDPMMYKNYEPMMYSLLRRFKIKRDYEDILQLLRIKTWEVLRDKKYKNTYKDKEGNVVEVKLSTWLYRVLFSRLQDILKIDYGVKIKYDGKSIDDQAIEKRIFYYLKNPILNGVMPNIVNHNSENEIRCRLDFELYYKQLKDEDIKIIDCMCECEGNKKEASSKLKCTVRHINRKLAILKKNYKNYLRRR